LSSRAVKSALLRGIPWANKGLAVLPISLRLEHHAQFDDPVRL
jgi:hypothetical protein